MPDRIPITLDRPYAPTLNAQIQYLVNTQPDNTALIFITHEGEETITTQEFFHQAAQYAYALQKLGVKSDDLVVLVLEHSLDVLYAFWGAIMIGAIPSIFPFLTEKLHPDRYFSSIQKLVKRSDVRAVITYEALREPLEDSLKDVDGLLLLLTEDLSTEGDITFTDFNFSPTPESTAFLQHSSGTTGLQKGVMLSHQAVLNQIANYGTAIQLSVDDVICSWLPLYHDMGLIAGFIMPIMQGIPLVLMSPFHWVRAPHLLLHAMQKHRGTLVLATKFRLQPYGNENQR